MSNVETDSTRQILDLYERARHERKGDYSVYNRLKQELDYMDISSVQYQACCRTLADILKV